MNYELVILGAGATGLAAGYTARAPIFEAYDIPGGICASYYIDQESKIRSSKRLTNQDDYRFELGGGHWIFGGDSFVLDFLSVYDKLISHQRNSAVFMPKYSIIAPYPLQNNLIYLPLDIKQSAEAEQVFPITENVKTLKQWLLASFGETLCSIFFFPFHQLYTAGLFEFISPQDQYKTPKSDAKEKLQENGYNVEFVYPKQGLDRLFHALSTHTEVQFNHKVQKINPEKKEIEFQSGTKCNYKRMISTIPLKRMIEICGIEISSKPDPHTSVLVLNIGARKGCKCPNHHWLYIPESISGFHRIGFYSNVDEDFLPKSLRGRNSHISAYIEKAFPGGMKPSENEINEFVKSISSELQEWGFIDDIEVADSTWIEYAYTWKYPESNWREEAILKLEKQNIFQAGRYGRWQFQGIAASIREGLEIGNRLKV